MRLTDSTKVKRLFVGGGFGLVAFLAGFLASSILSAFIAPIVKPLEQLGPYLFCPNPWFCKTYREFKANRVVQCETGDVGELLHDAIDDGDVSSQRHKSTRSLASRAYLCADASWGMMKSSEHLRKIAYYYGDCFKYVFEDKNKDEFSVRVGKGSGACISNIWQNPSTGMLDRTDYNQARVFCLGNGAGATRQFSKTTKLPICTEKELRTIGVPENVLCDEPSAVPP